RMVYWLGPTTSTIGQKQQPAAFDIASQSFEPWRNAAETQHVVFTIVFIAGGNVSRDADNELPSSILSLQDGRAIASGALSSQTDTPVAHDEDANESPKETLEVQAADQSPNETIEV
ncbi:hypothetical protein THAOC_22964, partial [Thalassiosira oceanica]